MLTALSFLITMSLLVTVHEYGHFQVAKWCGVKVIRFSIGFGKPLWSKTFGKDKTELVIAAIPLGGYVKMLDETELASEPNNTPINYSESELARAFNRQSVVKRIAIVLAGPVANLLLAIALYWLLFILGVVGMKPIIGKVIDQSPAALASFAEGEEIKKINGIKVNTWQEVSWLLLNESMKSKQLEIEAVSEQNEIHVHQLNLMDINVEDSTKDIIGTLGFTVNQPDIPALVGEITKNGPADLAGFKADDLVLSINKQQVAVWGDFVQEVRRHPSKSLEVLIQRNSSQLRLFVTPEQFEENGKSVGRIGLSFKMPQEIQNKLFVTSHYSASEALTKATERTLEISILTLKMLGKMMVGQASLSGVSGPVTIASYAGQSAQMGFKVFIGFLAVISISIGVLNLLPIPVLDGGHLMYYMVEIFTGKPTSDFVLNMGQRIGFILLGCMMILAFYNDINRLITG